ncbi:MAG TPA: thiamine phosphate synthase, partial [Reyranella sp.]|nr:thiamine phosphate synthase [Reyranella sp.]
MSDTRLYLVSPQRIDHPTLFADDLRHALDGGDVAAFLLRAPAARIADTLRPVCQQRGVAFFIAGSPDAAVTLDADGVHLESDGPSCAEARRIVGPDRQVGIASPSSRHFAMEAAEHGADYVAFDSADRELIEWWSGLFEIP